MGAAAGALGFGEAPARDVAVEHEGFGSKLTNAMCGMCFGFVLFIASFFLLGWNEFNYVNNQNVLLVVGAKTNEAPCTPNPGLGDVPIHTSCKIQRLHDFARDTQVIQSGMPRFDANLEGAWFGMSSQILQWTESKTQVSGSGSTKEYVYSYSLKWVDQPINSNSFYCYPAKKPGCKIEPASSIENYGDIPPVLSNKQVNAGPEEVGMGDPGRGVYWLNTGMFGAFTSTPVQLLRDQTGTPTPFNDRRWMRVTGNIIEYKRDALGRDTVGDVRTTFTKSNIAKGSTVVSVVAMQSAAGSGPADVILKPWDTKKGGSMNPVNWIQLGMASKDEMIADKTSQNNAMVILLRLLGFFCMFLGLQLITGPIALMPTIIPFCGDCLGSIVGCALCCMNFMISVAISLVVIGIAWLLARPLIGIVFLAIAALLVFGAVMIRNQYKKSGPEPHSGGVAMAPMAVPMATAVAVPRTIQVTCPAGVFPGQMVQVQGPDGRPYDVQVPAGVEPGQVFNVVI